MQTSDIVKLVNAGFTKEEIMQLASPAQTQVQPPTPVQTQVQTPTLVQTQVQTPTLVQPQVQPPVQMQMPPNVDYKMLYETQKQMLADMQFLNQRMNVGAPIDTVDSVMKDFLGGEK
jgi:hypothetical protein